MILGPELSFEQYLLLLVIEVAICGGLGAWLLEKKIR